LNLNFNNKLENLLSSSSALLDHFCNKTVKSDNNLSGYLETTLAEQLADVYCVFATSEFSGHENLVNIKEIVLDDYQSSYFHPIRELHHLINTEYSHLFKRFYIHGSMATLDYVEGWSDLDTLAVLENRVIQNVESLMELKKAIKVINSLALKICPLQHHGVLLLTTYDLNYYDNSRLPIEVFNHMRSLKKGEGSFTYNLTRREGQSKVRLYSSLTRLIKANEKGVFETHAYANEYLLAEYKNKNNGMYQFKYYLEQFTLLPSLFLSATGYQSYKRDSFKKVESIFSKEAIDFISKISYVRENWAIKEGVDYSLNKIPDWVQEVIPSNYFERGSLIAKEIEVLIKDEENELK